MIKKIAITLLVILLALITFIALYAIDADKNRGYLFGYYGDYNRIIEAIEEIPNIEIVESFAHRDISLEEIWIVLKTDDGKEVNLDVGQNEEFRKLKGKELVNELQKRIDKLRSNKSPQKTSASAQY